MRAADRSGRRLPLAWEPRSPVMNCCFYLAIDRLPLGTVAAIEFLPVIVLAALVHAAPGTPRRGLAVPGVYLLTGVQLDGEALGVGSPSPTRRCSPSTSSWPTVSRLEGLDGIDGLAASMLVAAVAVTPLAGWDALPALTDPLALAAGVGVGVSSSVIPYVSDQLAMRRLARSTYALMVSLLPATATVIGIVVLSQIPSPTELFGVSLVIAESRCTTEPREVAAASG